MPRAALVKPEVKVWWSQNFGTYSFHRHWKRCQCALSTNLKHLHYLFQSPSFASLWASLPSNLSTKPIPISVLDSCHTYNQFVFWKLPDSNMKGWERKSFPFPSMDFLGQQKVVCSVGPQTWGAKRRLEADREHGSLGFWNEISFHHRMCHFSFFTSTVLSDWFWSWKAFSIKQSPPPGIGHDARHGPWFARHRNG